MSQYFPVKQFLQVRRFLPGAAFLAVLLCLFPVAKPEAQAVQVTVAWDVSSDPDVAGYKLYVGTASRNYTVCYDVGKVFRCTIPDLQEGTTFYFAATAHDLYGNESDFSEELVYRVPGSNHPPVAQNGTLSTNQDTAATGTLVATDPDSDTLTYSVATQGAKGTATITGVTTGAYRYTPNSGARGSDTFAFKVSDAGGLTSTSTVAVTIVAVNHAPVAQNGVFSTAFGTAGSGVLVATDPDGDTLTYSIAGQGTRGTAAITNAASGSYLYTPNAGASGTDSFTFQVRDPGNLTSIATIAVTIAPGNQPPVAGNGALTTIQNTAATGEVTATDVNGDLLTYQVVSTATLGSVALNAATGSFTYTPNANSTGRDTFTFKANDGKADSNIASFAVTIKTHVNVLLEAEQGSLSAPMVLATDSKASGGQYIWIPNGTGDLTQPLATGGQALYSFDIPAAGNYRVWGRVIANTVSDNSFFISMDYGPSIVWHTAIGIKETWMWDQVTDQNEADAVTFYLTAGTHTLIVKQMEDGTKLDSIRITTQTAWIAETVYSDAETGGIEGWDVFDAAPAGATISNMSDEERGGRVIQLAGSRTDNGYRLRTNAYSNWANGSQFVIEWSMKYSESFVVYVEVQTTRGYRYFQYEPINIDYLGRSSQVRLGMGTGAKDGQWHTFTRDLQADLTRAQYGTAILQVNAFSVRGSGKIDDVKLRESY